MTIYTDPNRRHDFILLFDILDGNPNGDPDGGNLPRTDAETLSGLVTDVCLKRKIRNYVATYTEYEASEAEKERLKIFVEHHGVLNEQIRRAYVDLGFPVGKSVTEPIKDNKVLTALKTIESDLPSAFTVDDPDDEDAEDTAPTLTYNGELSDVELKSAWAELDDLPDWKTAKKFVLAVVKKAGKPDKNRDNANKAKDWMCQNFFDVRMFGAVMSTGLNAGQVRGPVQLTFSRSLDPVLPMDWAVTRVAVTDAADREKLQTIGRKTQIPYGLFRGSGFFSPFLAQQTGVTTADLQLFWDAIQGMWDLDRSASRGMMALRGLYIFSHDKRLGNAPAHKLFDLIKVEKNPDVSVPRSFGNYEVTLPTQSELNEQYPGVTLTCLEG
ncbi:type I-C CRISPR-associated protein Cas7/Csd2 [Spirulina sp.]|uniref:type I-C CRISPR-associated protein Cas7/Csd2 n=1 Tax=Spirulina sp. TaxID=1157 RepID=UPI003F727E87